jgi:release factor glutamine methyltransferase
VTARSVQVPATAGTVVRVAASRLAQAGVPSPHVDARWLVAHTCGVDPWGDPDLRLDDESVRALESAVARRAAREPLQLVVGETAFCDLTLRCRPGVFVPRPETEVLAMRAVEAARGLAAPTIVEPCTGSGAVAAVLLAHVPGAQVLAIDVDPWAAALAEENFERVRAGVAGHPPAVGARAEVRVGDLLAPVPAELQGRVDVLVANPPYLPASDAADWDPEVRHDPPTALIGGPDGHELVDRLLVEAVIWLAPGGAVLVEIDARRADSARHAASAAGLVEVGIVDDLTGAPRMLVARAPGTRRPIDERADG